jgi:hypothetical protein
MIRGHRLTTALQRLRNHAKRHDVSITVLVALAGIDSHDWQWALNTRAMPTTMLQQLEIYTGIMLR